MRHQKQLDAGEPVFHWGVVAYSAWFACEAVLALALCGCRDSRDKLIGSNPDDPDWQTIAELYADHPFQTCHRCWSTRIFDRSANRYTVDYRSPGYATCEHVWEAGISKGVNDAVKDGTVVLVYKDGIYGAFIPLAQADNAGVKYRWFYRTDGLGRFDVDEKAVLSGEGEAGEANGQAIAFGTFSVGWSAGDAGHGWIYYDVWPGDVAGEGDHWLCVTGLNEVSGLDAADPKWVYKSFLGDPGRTSAEFSRRP